MGRAPEPQLVCEFANKWDQYGAQSFSSDHQQKATRSTQNHAEVGDLTAVDMARIIDRLTTPELNRWELDQS